MKLTESLKYPTIAEIEEVKKTMAHKYIYDLTPNNTSMLTLDYPAGITLHEACTAFDQLMNALAKEVGLGLHGLAWFGVILERNSKGRVWPHIHLIVHSKRSRKTGRTVASMPFPKIRKLQRLWARLVNWEDPSSRPMDLQRAHDAVYLTKEYIPGPANLQAPKQRYRLIEHNIGLLNKKAERAQMQAAA